MLLLTVLFLSAFPSFFSAQQLSPSFYSSSCPNVVSTVTNSFLAQAKKDNVVAPSTLRLVLHDCFIEGCDASILVSSTSGNQAERDAPENKNLPQNAFDAVNNAKQAVEAICPGVVSCADILALTTKDAIVFLGGPTWDVPLGRRDGVVSKASDVAGRIPGASLDVTQLEANFGAQGLSLQDIVVLSGAHSIGFTHCDAFSSRLYSFNSSVQLDPSINPTFVPQLKQKCVQNGANNLQALDATTPFVFDNQFYKDLQAGKGILFTDQVLFQDSRTQAMVNSFAADQAQFFQSFTASMIKLTSIGVKTGTAGEIRKVCSSLNQNGSPPANPAVSPPVSPKTPPPSPPIQPPSPVLPPPPVTPPPTVTPPPLLPPPPVSVSPPPIVVPPPPQVFPPPTVTSTPPPTLPPPVFPPPPIPANPSNPNTPPGNVPSNPAPEEPSTPEPNPPPPGFTIPGIPGFSPPFTVPRIRIPRIGVPPPPSN